MMKKILIIEDNQMISKGLKYLLEQERYLVDICSSLLEAKRYLDANTPNLIILDITLPDGDGFDFCKYINNLKKEYSKYDIPIVVLTAKDEETDIVKGFDLGAEEYIVKPFKNRELVYRVANVLKRYENKEINKSLVRSGNISINLEENRVYCNNNEIIFTPLEYRIIHLLFINIGKNISREKILEKVWDIDGNFVNDNTLTVYIKRIREKLGKNDIIKTVKGIGYRVDNEN